MIQQMKYHEFICTILLKFVQAPKFSISSFSSASHLAKSSRFILIFLFILFSFVQNSAAQEVIVHAKLSQWEDGDIKRDADGNKNGTVIWKSGAIHVIDGDYTVELGYGENSATLIVEPGAIIKVAGQFVVVDGKLQSWTAPMMGGVLAASPKTRMILNGVTITDIQDDVVGGDTNQDGASTSPSLQWGIIRMSGGNKDAIENCVIKYCAKLGGFGSINISKNHFIEFGEISSSSGYPGYTGDVVLNAVPVISGNTFEFYYNGRLDLTGMSPVVEGNTIRGASIAILVGPRFLYGDWPEEPAGPISGTTIISDNTIENCETGIEVSPGSSRYTDDLLNKTPPFCISIRNNKLEGKGGYTGINVGFSNKAQVVHNTINNFGKPIMVLHDYRYEKFTGDAVNGLSIRHNRLTSQYTYGGIDSISYKYWGKGIFIDAQYNFWGNLSGPEDKSNKDGISNPYGKGLKIGDGVDYRNFIGAAQVILDAIKIRVSSDPSAPLIPKSIVTFQVHVDEYTLQSSQTGKITVMVRDETGMILNNSGTLVEATRGTHSMEIAPIQVSVPEFASQLTVEASISPDGENTTTVFSNPEIFMVDQPQSTFQLTSIKDVATGKYPDLQRSTKVTLRFEFLYLLGGTGNGSFEIKLQDRVRGSGKILQDYPTSALEIKPGSNQKASMDIEVTLGDCSIFMQPGEQNELLYQISMKDDQGKTVGNYSGILPIRVLDNFAHISMARPIGQKGNQVVSFGADYYLSGQVPAIGVWVFYKIEKPDITNWQIQVGPLDVLTASGNVIYSYLPSTVHWRDLQTTGSLPKELSPAIFMMPPGSPPLPADATKIRVHISLIDPGKNSIVYTEHRYEIPVLNASQSVEKDVPVGPSQVSFDQIPVRLNFTSNNSSGLAVADEFNTPYSLQNKSAGALAESLVEGISGGFISLNRYWAVHDTLKESSFEAKISITYDPARDFPSHSEFSEDSLVLASINRNNGELEILPSILDKPAHSITADYSKFYNFYIAGVKTASFTGVNKVKEVPGEFILMQNYPNPFNPLTAIRYNIPELSYVRLKVYDIIGREITTLVDKKQNAGVYTVIFNATSLPTGIYMLNIQAGRFRETKKMILLR